MAVALGKDRVGERPANANLRVIPAQAARQLGLVKLGHLVKHLAVVSEALEAV